MDDFDSVAKNEIQGADFTGDGRLFGIASYSGASHNFNEILEFDPTTGQIVPPQCELPAGTPQDINSLDVNLSGEFRAVTRDGGGAPNKGVFSLDFDACGATWLGYTDPALGALASFRSKDCNTNSVPDECDIAAGTSADCNANGVPDDCEEDCNANGLADECDPLSVLMDLDGDTDVDVNDFLTFSNCFNGALNPPRPACLSTCADANADGDVDVSDFLTFSNCFNGALYPPRCP